MTARERPVPEPHNTRADHVRGFPVEAWEPKAGRRYVILGFAPKFTDDTTVRFRCRWLDEDRVWTWTVNQSALMQIIGTHDWGPRSHPDEWVKVADPDGWAADDERKNRRFGVLR